MKKNLLVFLAILVFFSFYGCGSEILHGSQNEETVSESTIVHPAIEPFFIDSILHTDEEVNNLFFLTDDNMSRQEIGTWFTNTDEIRVDEDLIQKAKICGQDFDISLRFDNMQGGQDKPLLVSFSYILDCSALSEKEIFDLVKQVAYQFEEAYGKPITREKEYSIRYWRALDEVDYENDERHALWDRWLIPGEWRIPGTEKEGMLEAEIMFRLEGIKKLYIKYMLIWDEKLMPQESYNEDGELGYWL